MDNKKDLAYYLTLYKLEGHETWRAHLAQRPEGMEIEAKNNHWPTVTEKQVLRIDRITGTFSQGK